MIKYGSHVAFLHEGAIRFGYIAAIINRTDAKGETTEHVVTHNWQEDDGSISAAIDVKIGNEEDLAELEGWNVGDKIHRLARRSALWAKSSEQSDAILHPVEPAPAVVEPPDPSPVVPELRADERKTPIKPLEVCDF